MKIYDFFITNDNLGRHHKISKLNSSKYGLIRFLGRIYNIISAKAWHHTHTQEEKNQPAFFCEVCDYPEHYDWHEFLSWELMFFLHYIDLFTKLQKLYKKNRYQHDKIDNNSRF